MEKDKEISLLSLWLQRAKPEQKKELAELCGTSTGYLKLLAQGHRENPKLRLALAIVYFANVISKCSREMGQTPSLPRITLQDLAATTKRGLTPNEYEAIEDFKGV